MKKFIIGWLLVLNFVSIFQVKAQKNEGVATAVGALAGAIAVGASAAAAAEEYNEYIELQGTQWILSNTDYTVFSLERIERAGTKSKDQSAVSIHAFKFSANGKGRFILLALMSHGWVNENGVKETRIVWELIDRNKWFDMIRAYVKRASDVELDFNQLATSVIVNDGVKKGMKFLVKFPNLGGDYYKVTNYDENYKIVFNEKSFGLFIKETGDLVQLSRGVLVKAHKFMANIK